MKNGLNDILILAIHKHETVHVLQAEWLSTSYTTVQTQNYYITLYGHCCRYHLVGQPVVRDIRVVVIMPASYYIRLLVAVRRMPILLHTPNVTCPTTWRHVMMNLVMSLHLVQRPSVGLIYCLNQDIFGFLKIIWGFGNLDCSLNKDILCQRAFCNFPKC